MPAPTDQALSDEAVRQLETELRRRALLLKGDALAAAEAEAAREGARLLGDAMQRCYSRVGEAVQLDFGSDGTAARLAAALAFGAVSARVLVQRRDPAPGVELLCGVFNLGIGLVDNVCDEDPGTGAALLELVRRHDLVDASAEPRERGWLRCASASLRSRAPSST